MSAPRFLGRAIDAAVPALGGLDRDTVKSKLEATSVSLIADEQAREPSRAAGFLLAANLLSRLYPRIVLRGPQELVCRARDEVLAINPSIDLDKDGATSATLIWDGHPRSDRADTVCVSTGGWNVHIDDPSSDTGSPVAAPAALAAAALGVAEIFRAVFARELGARGRQSPQSGSFNLVTMGERRDDLQCPARFDIGEFALVGAGAIGQAAAHTLVTAGAHGTMSVIDHEAVALSNLQRYVLAGDNDVDAIKVELLRDRLSGSELEVVPIQARWHAGLADVQRPTLVALDSPEDRIGVQASLPGPIYNAWTQPADIGWSRHERFGIDPCLACLYWPDRPRPHLHEQIADAFRQDPRRVLAYLVRRLPAGLPLPSDAGTAVVPGLPQPASDASAWARTPILDNIASVAGVDASLLAMWRERELTDLYRDGICGGALLHLDVGTAPREVLVPLAHQSALAGVMLATQLLIAQTPELAAARSEMAEGRYDVLAGLPQRFARPRTQTPGCLCADSVFLDVYRSKFGNESLVRAT